MTLSVFWYGVKGALSLRIFDGVSDIFFGTLIDKTRTRMGRARPWMLWAFFGCAAMIVAIFAISASLGDNAKYAWFFITYTLLNAGFYTANNIAYSTLTALITKNSAERVQMGSIRFIFAFSTSLLIQTVTVKGVEFLGGGAQGWRAIAIIYALIGLAANTLSVMSVRELPASELEDRSDGEEGESAMVVRGQLVRQPPAHAHVAVVVNHLAKNVPEQRLASGRVHAGDCPPRQRRSRLLTAIFRSF